MAFGWDILKSEWWYDRTTREECVSQLPSGSAAGNSVGSNWSGLASFSVRFLDNFSAGSSIVSWAASHSVTSIVSGTRGATSAEYFLKAGYAVIFMHRQFSLQPFSRHYSHTTNPFLDILYLSSTPSADGTGAEREEVVIKSEGLDFLTQVLKARQDALSNRNLHTLTFVTVNEYLFLLRAISGEMSKLKRASMYYLAAAVSDFFLPTQKMVRAITELASHNCFWTHWGSTFRASTRSSRGKEVSKLRWIKYPRSCSPWWQTGRLEVLSFPLK